MHNQPIESEGLDSRNTSRRGERTGYYDALVGAFVAVYLSSQIASTKLIEIGSLTFSGGIIVFPIAFIFGDVLTEVYGYARARRAIWIAFLSAAFLALTLWAVQHLKPAPAWNHQQEFENVLGQVPRVVIASLISYWLGEFANSFVMAKMKVITNGAHLWSRTIGSTIVGQLVDSLVFIGVAFGGLVPTKTILSITANIYVAKVVYEILATPLTYLCVAFLKEKERADPFDRGVSFSPFKW